MHLFPAIRKPTTLRVRGMVGLILLMLLPELRAQMIPALVARTNIYLSGNVVVDSFDSRDPSYSISGRYDPSRRKDGGHLVLAENRTNARINVVPVIGGSIGIYGKVYIGDEEPEIYVGGNGTNAALGSMNWVDGDNPGIEPGWLVKYAGTGIYLPDAPMPPTGGLPLPARTTIAFQGAVYNNSYLLTGNGGNYQAGGFTLSSSEKLLVQGNVKLYVVTDLRMTGQGQIIVGTHSSLTMYVGRSADFAGGGVINRTGFATNLTVYGLNTCTNIQYTGGSDFIGFIYAPNSSFRMSGGGNSIYNLIGSVVANSITINGHYEVHCDEGLRFIPFPMAVLRAPAVGANGLFQFQVSGVWFANYAVQSSSNLIDWVSIYTNSSPFTFTNTETGSDQQFFRAVYLP